MPLLSATSYLASNPETTRQIVAAMLNGSTQQAGLTLLPAEARDVQGRARAARGCGHAAARSLAGRRRRFGRWMAGGW
jgi:hypothetical protein